MNAGEIGLLVGLGIGLIVGFLMAAVLILESDNNEPERKNHQVH